MKSTLGVLVTFGLLWATSASAGPPAPASPQHIEAICGSHDTRVFSQDKAVGRVLAEAEGKDPCTAFLIQSGALLTAGHCVKDGLKLVEFNVPKSNSNGTMNHPKPEDQYAVRQDSIVFSNDPDKGDWAVFQTYKNGITLKTPLEAQGAFYEVTQQVYPKQTQLRVTGFGQRNDPKDLNFAQQTGTGPLVDYEDDPWIVWHRVDTTSSNSGSPVSVDGTSKAIAIHVAGTCQDPVIKANGGTSFKNPGLWKAIQSTQQ